MLSLTLFSCGKEKGGTKETAPTNLTISATVQPDNSGNVLFTAAATNAVSYDYDFGNGIFQTAPSGTTTYKYPASGTFEVKVTAKSSSGKTVFVTTTVTISIAAQLVWSDEFNGNGAPDPTKWGYDLGAGGWGNQELEFYTNRPENIVQEGGSLKIKAIRENYQGSTFSSARILSKGKFNFTYGRVEAYAKLPAGVGTWPAIWALGSNVDNTPWPACGEIDIMEHVGRNQNKIYGTLHYPGHFGGSADGGTKDIADATQWHKYELVWTPSVIKMLVDGAQVHSVANSPAIPFNHDFFLIMNVAMGGNFAGPVAAGVNGGTMEVDYIRVYNQ